MIVFGYYNKVSPFTILVNIELIVNFIFNPLVALWVIILEPIKIKLLNPFFFVTKSLK
jgi:hypothetical protein